MTGKDHAEADDGERVMRSDDKPLRCSPGAAASPHADSSLLTPQHRASLRPYFLKGDRNADIIEARTAPSPYPTSIPTVQAALPQHFLYFFPLPHGQGSLRPALGWS